MMEKLYSAANYIEANTIKAMLNNAGIEVFLKGEALAGAMGELPADVSQIEVMVKSEQLTQAYQMIQEFQQLSGSKSTHWNCNQCGEENAPAFEFCWNCHHDRP